MPLTPKQAAFVAAYLVDSNGKKAAIKAGYSKAGAEVAASRLLRHVKVAAALEQARNPAIEVPKDEPVPAGQTPLEYMLAVMNNQLAEDERRDNMAKAAAPFVHAKLGEGGKKEQQDAAAKKVAGRFAPAAPPKLVAAGGKKV